MSIKQILVHLALDEDREIRLKTSVALAHRFDAHLICLYVAAAVHMPAGAAGRGASAAYIAEARDLARSRSGEIRDEAEALCAASGISYEWAYGETDHFDQLMEHVHRTDLTVVTQVQFDHFEDRLMFQLPELVIQEAGGMVLVLPKGHAPAKLDEPIHTMIAWRFSKEAMRAVRDSLEILRDSKKVTILALQSHPERHAAPNLLQEYLARHGVAAEVVSKDHDEAIGEQILDTAHTLGVDRLVMGGYGRSSLSERLFFGPSRYVLGHSAIPIYMSH
ncbi:MAG: universal stress protein [Alphaproteobacteria bacterium]|nr:universal stress protein [Alphaproteobacteria bacterium]